MPVHAATPEAAAGTKQRQDHREGSTDHDVRGSAEGARKAGAAHCTDAELMASFCDGTAQLLIGAVSPRLVWEGAMSKGMTTKQLATLMHDDPIAAADLMWA